jgi:hypothetical protein
MMFCNIFHIAVISYYSGPDGTTVGTVSYGAILLLVLILAIRVHVVATERAINRPHIENSSGYRIIVSVYAYIVCAGFFSALVLNSWALRIQNTDLSIDHALHPTGLFIVLFIEAIFLTWAGTRIKHFVVSARGRLSVREMTERRTLVIILMIASFLILMHWVWALSMSLSTVFIGVAFVYATSIFSVDWLFSLTDPVIMEPW